MNAHLVILAALTTLAHARLYPPQPSTGKLIAEVVKDRKVNAPFYAESPVRQVIPTVRELAKPAEVPVLDRIDAAPANTITPRSAELTPGEAAARSVALRSLEMRPDIFVVGPVDFRKLDPTTSSNPLTLLAATPVKTLPSWTNLSVDPFMLKVEFLWQKPHGQWMNSMLKQINAARAAGDTETYNTLTARYSAWAEKYLRQDDPPDLDGNPSR
jgi:hypothetical protein